MPTCSFSLNLPALHPLRFLSLLCKKRDLFVTLLGHCGLGDDAQSPPCTGESLCGSCKAASSFFLLGILLLELEDPSGGSNADPSPDPQCPKDTQVNKSLLHILPDVGSADPQGWMAHRVACPESSTSSTPGEEKHSKPQGKVK